MSLSRTQMCRVACWKLRQAPGWWSAENSLFQDSFVFEIKSCFSNFLVVVAECPTEPPWGVGELSCSLRGHCPSCWGRFMTGIVSSIMNQAFHVVVHIL